MPAPKPGTVGHYEYKGDKETFVPDVEPEDEVQEAEEPK